MKQEPKRYIAVSGENLVRMAEMLEAGATLRDLITEFPAVDPRKIGDLIEGWE